jgi:hypothetical protein
MSRESNPEKLRITYDIAPPMSVMNIKESEVGVLEEEVADGKQNTMASAYKPLRLSCVSLIRSRPP